MNFSNFEHALYAVLIQLGTWAVTGSLLAGAALAFGFFLGREHSQREEIISPHNRDNPFPAFRVWEWTLDEQLDLLFPLVAVCLVLLLARFL